MFKFRSLLSFSLPLVFALTTACGATDDSTDTTSPPSDKTSLSDTAWDGTVGDSTQTTPCTTNEDCDLGDDCRVGTCDLSVNECVFEVKAGQCFANGACYDEGGIPEDNLCQWCDPSFSAESLNTKGCDDNEVCEPSTGGCVCAPGWSGDDCATPVCIPSCGDHGACTAPDTCTCDPGYAGSNCLPVDPEKCDGNGIELDDGTCDCSSGFAGSDCAYSDAESCFDHGVAQADGSCVCDEGWEASDCSIPTCEPGCGDQGSCVSPNVCACDPGFVGPQCVAAVEGECNENGILDESGACLCSAGFAGPSCEFSDTETCHGKGVAQADGACVCAPEWAGSDCTECLLDEACTEPVQPPFNPDPTSWSSPQGSCWIIDTEGFLGPDEHMQCLGSAGTVGPDSILSSAPFSPAGNGVVGVQLRFAWLDPGPGKHSVSFLATKSEGDFSQAQVLGTYTIEGINEGEFRNFVLSEFMASQQQIWIGVQVDSDAPELLDFAFDDLVIAPGEAPFFVQDVNAQGTYNSDEDSVHDAGSVSVFLGTTLELPFSVHDPDGFLSLLSFELINSPDFAALSPTVNDVDAAVLSVTLTLSPEEESAVGEHSFSVLATDGSFHHEIPMVANVYSCNGTVETADDGAQSCVCSTGWEGVDCQSCAPGYVGEACEPGPCFPLDVVDPCETPNGDGVCADGFCTVSACDDFYYNLNGDDTDGCEYYCSGNTEAEEACNGLDENCNGSIDEGCTGTYLDDSWFGGLVSNVVTWGDVTANTFEIGAQGVFHAGPLGDITVSGTVSQAGNGDPVVWCFSGMKSFDMGGLNFEDVTVTVCRDSNGDVTTALEGAVEVEGNVTEFTGTLDLSDPWKLTVQIENIPLTDFLVLDNVKLSISKGASQFNLTADLSIGSGEDPLDLHITGVYYTTGTMSLSATLSSDEGWKPFDNLDLTFTEIQGTVKRKSGEWTASIAVNSDFNLPLAPGFGLGITSFEATLSTTGDWAFAIAGSADLGPLGTIEVTGDVAKGNETQPFVGCLSAVSDQELLGLALNGLTVSVCVDEEGTVVTSLSGEAELYGEIYPFSGTVTQGDETVVTIQLGNIPLWDGIVITDVVLTAGTGDTAYQLTGNLQVFGMNMDVSGSYVPNGDYSLSLALSDIDWKPFDQLDLTFDAVSGSISRVNGATTLSVDSNTLTSYEITPGLTFNAVTVGGTISTDGTQELRLGGNFNLEMGESSTNVYVQGSVNESGGFTLLGTYDGVIEPLEGLIGADRFSLYDFAIELTVQPGAGYSVELSTKTDICFEWSGCSDEKPPFTISLVGAIIGSKDYYLKGYLPEYDFPGFGALPDVVVIASSIDMPDQDVFDTPEDSSDDEDVDMGITLVVEADSPLPFFDEVETLKFFFNMRNMTEISVKAKIGLDWEMFGPDVIPTIDYMKLIGVYFKGSISGPELKAGFGAEVEFKPSNQDSALEGTAEIAVDNVGAAEATIYINGRWEEPLGIDGFSVQNPALTAELLFSTGLPVPTSLGFNGDLFWLRPGYTEWPPENDDLEDAPESVLKIGGSFFFDKTPKESGLCLIKPCPVMPPFLFRVDIQNLSADDMLHVVNGLRNNLVDNFGLGEFLPEQDLDSVELTINDNAVETLFYLDTMKLYVSTHNKILWGMRWSAGFKAELDATILDKDIYFRGELDRSGLVLHGQMSPLKLDAGQFLQADIVGDPFRKIAELNGGHIEIPHRDDFNLNQGTIETWIKGSAWSDDAFGAIAVQKLGGGDGYRVGMGAPIDGKARVSAEFIQAGVSQIVSTDEGVLDANKWHHIAVNFHQGDVAIYVDGSPQLVSREGTPTGPGFNNANIEVGANLEAVDDLRFWSDIRNTSQIAGAPRILPMGYHNEPTLAARYEFDYDTSSDTFNSRYQGEGADQLHGSYSGAAQSILSWEDQDLYFKLALKIPGQGETNGLWLRTGLRLGIPMLNWEWAGSAKVQIGDGQASGSFYMPEFTFLNMPNIGAFYLSGHGPNLVGGDFDDGVYTAFDLKQLSFAGTGEFGFLNSDAQKNVIGSANVSYLCPTGSTCDGLSGYVFDADGYIDLTADLPSPFGTFGLQGQGAFNSAEARMSVDGHLIVFGQDLISSAIEINSEQINLSSELNLNALSPLDIGGVTLDLTFLYEGPQLCGVTTTDLTIPGLNATFMSNVDVCLGNPQHLNIMGQAQNLTVLGFGLEEVFLSFSTETQHYELTGSINLPLFSGQVHGVYDGPDSFAFDGQTQISLAGFEMANANIHLSNDGMAFDGMVDILGNSVQIAGSLNADGSWSASGGGTLQILGVELANAEVILSNDGAWIRGETNVGPISTTLSGSITPDTFNLQGEADISFGGFTLANASAFLSNTQGFGASGLIDIGIADASLDASCSVPTNSCSFAGDLDIAITQFLQLTGQIQLNNQGLSIDGSIDFLTLSAEVSGSITAGSEVCSSCVKEVASCTAGAWEEVCTEPVCLETESQENCETIQVPYWDPNCGNFGCFKLKTEEVCVTTSVCVDWSEPSCAQEWQAPGCTTTTEMTECCSTPGTDFSLSGAASLSVPTPFGTYNLANSTMTLGYNSGNVSLDAQGQYSIPGLVNVGLSAACDTAAGTYSFTGQSALSLGSFDIANASLSLDKDNGLVGAGSLTLPLVSADLSGLIRPNGNFALSGGVDLSAFGHNLLNANGSLTNSGFSVSGAIDAGIVEADLSGSVYSSGSFTLVGSTNLTVAGFNLLNTNVELKSSNGLKIYGNVDIGIIDADLSASVSSNGAFTLSGSTNLTVPTTNFTLFNASVSLSTTQGFQISTGLDIGIFDASISGTASSNGNLRLTGSTSITAPVPGGSWIIGSGNSASVDLLYCRYGNGICAGKSNGYGHAKATGNINILQNTVSMTANIKSTGWSFTGHHDLSLPGTSFELLNTDATLTQTQGMRLASTLDLGFASFGVSGSLNPNNKTFSLSSQAGVNILNNPQITGQMTIAGSPKSTWPYYTVGCSGSGSFSFFGIGVDADLSVDSSLNLSFSGTASVSADLEVGGLPGDCDCYYGCGYEKCGFCCPCYAFGAKISDSGCAGYCGDYVCKNVCDYCLTCCDVNLGGVDCEVNVAGSNQGFQAEFGASCDFPIIGEKGITIDADDGKACATIPAYGWVCTPSLW